MPEELSSELTQYESESLQQGAAHRPDWLLQTFVRMMNDRDDPGMSMGVTLLIGGALVSGRLIGAREYFTLLGEQFDSGEERPDATPVMFKQIMDELYPRGAPSRTTGDVSFIHLKNARVFHGRTPINDVGVLWRGRLSSVGGFMLGEAKINTEV